MKALEAKVAAKGAEKEAELQETIDEQKQQLKVAKEDINTHKATLKEKYRELENWKTKRSEFRQETDRVKHLPAREKSNIEILRKERKDLQKRLDVLSSAKCRMTMRRVRISLLLGLSACIANVFYLAYRQSGEFNIKDVVLPLLYVTNHFNLEVEVKCQLRDLSKYNATIVGSLHKTALPTDMKKANCLFFECNRKISECDNGHPTNFDGPKPPCCTHIFRDMARTFDETMCGLGIDYFAAYGTLLGFRRRDSVIPWTADNDYMIPSVQAANAMVDLWDADKTGMAHIHQNINRMCVTPAFAGGALQRRWARKKPLENFGMMPRMKWQGELDFSGLPYMDFYIGHRLSTDIYSSIEMNHCRHRYKDVFPTKREMVYNKTFTQNWPANPDQLLRTIYGQDWMTPPSTKSRHGMIRRAHCAHGPTFGSGTGLVDDDEVDEV